jgi:toluene monooxygenase system protein A
VQVLKREHWLGLARELDWDFSYVQAREVFPGPVSGQVSSSVLDADALAADGRSSDHSGASPGAEIPGPQDPGLAPDPAWSSAVKLRMATLAGTEFAAAVGKLRAARFANRAAWRSTACLAALAALRRAQLPLASMARRADAADAQLDWTRQFLRSDQWTAIAVRHFVDELLLCSNPTELAVAGGFVFESAFKPPQLARFASLAHAAGDTAFQRLMHGMGADASREALLGRAAVMHLVARDRKHAQYLVDKWFWRAWLLLGFESGIAIDYLTPLSRRDASFAEFARASIVAPFAQALEDVGLELPWYWPELLETLEIQHHMLYASLYTHRRTLWFDTVLPGPAERAWLRRKYPRTWDQLDPIWACIAERWRKAGEGVEWYVHGTSPPAVCSLCQLLLCGGTPRHNHAQTREHGGRRRIFCSAPCAWIFEREPWRYAAHRDLAARIEAGSVPGNLLELVTRSFGLRAGTWGSDVQGGNYSWLRSDAP